MMKVTLAYVATLNGKITKGDDANVSAWSSKEDQEHYKSIRNNSDVIIRSSTTYKIAKPYLEDGPLHIVFTRDPSKYESEAVEGKIDFTNESPSSLITRLRKQNYKNVLLSIGGNLVAEFFKANLIDEFLLTLEPKVFGSGVNMVADSDFESNFKLMSSEKLNKSGTLLLKYSRI